MLILCNLILIHMEDLLKKIQQIPEYDQILKQLNAAPPESREQMLSLLEKYVSRPKEGEMDEEGGVLITPKKCFVFKTSNLDTRYKVFLNICSHEIVDPPNQQDVPDQDEHVGIRIPLSLGGMKEDADKSK